MSNEKHAHLCQSCGWPLSGGWFDDARRTVIWRDGKRVAVPKTEWEMLSFFRKHPGQVMPFERIWNALYLDRDDPPADNNVRVHVLNLRQRLSGTPYRIIARYRQGYVFDMERPEHERRAV